MAASSQDEIFWAAFAFSEFYGVQQSESLTEHPHASTTNMPDLLQTESWESYPASNSGSTLYQARLLGSQQFRVVEIAQGQWDDPIRCTLKIVVFDQPFRYGPYKALSYVWGSPVVTDTIHVDGLPVKITLNLFCALRYLRMVGKSNLLWIDALVSNASPSFDSAQEDPT